MLNYTEKRHLFKGMFFIAARCIQPLSRDERNGPGFHYVIRWRQHQRTRQRAEQRKPHSSSSSSVSSRAAGYSELVERRVEANITELIVGGLPVFRAYDVYVVSVNDIGPAVAARKLVIAYTGEDGLSVNNTRSCLYYYYLLLYRY